MKRLLEPKIRIVLAAGIGLAALVLLSPALRQLTFQPSLPFSVSLAGLYGQVSLSPGESIPSWKIMLFGVLLVVILVVIFFLLDPEQRKRLLQQILRFTLIFGLTAWLLTNLNNRGVLQNLINGVSGGSGGNPAAVLHANLPAFIPPEVSPWLIFAVSFCIALGLIAAGWYIFSLRRRESASSAMDELAGIASQVLSELEPGRNWDDAIVRAYVQMNEVVMAARHVERQPGSTPREFARRMEQMGLPGEAVRSLTGLFEGVRYGGKLSTPADREMAVAALNAIIRACGRQP